MTDPQPDAEYVRVHFEHDLRSYLPEIRWDWYDNDAGGFSASVGNRHCDKLFGVTVELQGPWLRRIGDWLDRRAQSGRAES